MIGSAREFVTRVYLPDLFLIASHYEPWASMGSGIGNYLVYGDYPLADGPGAELYFMPGILLDRDPCMACAVHLLDASGRALVEVKVR